MPERIFDVQTPGLGESSRDEIPLHHALDILDAAASRPDASRWAAFARAQAPARPSMRVVTEQHLQGAGHRLLARVGQVRPRKVTACPNMTGTPPPLTGWGRFRRLWG